MAEFQGLVFAWNWVYFENRNRGGTVGDNLRISVYLNARLAALVETTLLKKDLMNLECLFY